MTDEVVATEPADHRRAAALLSHRATGDETGAQYIIEEATSANRQTELLAALVDSGGKLLAALRTDMGMEAVGSLFDTWANQDENVDYRPAASISIARFQSNPRTTFSTDISPTRRPMAAWPNSSTPQRNASSL